MQTTAGLTELNFYALVDLIPHLVWMTNAEGLVEYCNQRWYEYTGLKPELTRGDGWATILHPEDTERCLVMWYESVNTGTRFEFEYRIKEHTTQAYRWFLVRATPLRNANGEIIKWLGTSTNVDDLKQAENSLKTITDQLNLTLQAARAGTWCWNINTNKISWDTRIYELFGLPVNSVIPSYEEYLTSIHPQDRQDVITRIEKALTSNDKYYNAEYRIIWHDNTIRTLNTFGKVFVDQHGSPSEMIGICWDITEQKAIEYRARQQQIALAHVSKLSSMEEVATTLAHELNQPLTAITTYAQLCLSKMQNLDIAQKELVYLEHIAKQAERAGAILHRVKSFTQQKSLLCEKVNLHTLIGEALEFMQYENFALFPEIKLDFAPELPEIQLDKIQIQQVLINLFKNSIEAMQEIGTINPLLTIHTRLDSLHKIYIAVSDNGPGVPVDLQAKILEPYFTTKAQGTGIGLSICRTIIEAHGGQLSLNTSGQIGTCFQFTLPITG